MRLCALLFGLILTGVTASQSVDEPLARRALVISLDGGRPDAILQASTPHMQALAARGAATWQAQTVYPSVTLIAHASMLTGLSIERHGLNHNDSLYPCPVLQAPTFLTLAQQAGYKTAIVSGKGQFCQFDQSDDTSYSFAQSGDRSVVDRVIELIDDGCEVIFAHFPNPDYFGHLTGWMSATYQHELGNTDFQVGRLLAALDERGLTAETLIILTADHGGHGTGHGTDLPEDMLIPWIIAGPGVAAGTDLSARDIRVMDTAPTILWALGVPLPDNLSGRVVSEAFTAPASESTPAPRS